MAHSRQARRLIEAAARLDMLASPTRLAISAPLEVLAVPVTELAAQVR